jgi:hypothetical protein
MPLLESQVDSKIVTWFKRTYPAGAVIKLAMVGAHGTAGWPDRLFLHGGESVYMELKATGKAPTDLQFARMKQLADAGCKWVTWTDDPNVGIRYLMGVFK